MEVVRNDKVIDAQTYAYSTTLDIDMTLVDQGSVQIVYADATPAVKTFTDTDVDADANTVTIAAHGFMTGVKVVTTTSGAAPGGLTAGTYYIIKISSSVIKFASSLANAKSGTAVNITTAGGVGDTQTITPASQGGVVFTIYGSNDGSNFSTLSLTTNNTGSGNALHPLVDKFYKYIRLEQAITAGAITLTAILHGRRY